MAHHSRVGIEEKKEDSAMNQTSDQPATVEELTFSQKLYQQLYQRLSQLPWYSWAAIFIVVSGGIGFTATSALLKLPKSPQCAKIFWPVASASMRLYCAGLAADERTVDGLLRAIKLVESLPQDHPLRHEIDRNVEEWAVEILDLAEDKFQSGELEEAIATARQIPAHLKANSVVEERIERWRSIWSEGEEIFAEVERQLRETNWNQAFREAVKLLNLDNQYWATTKYDETVNNIQLAQEESRKLDNAFAILRRGGVDNWLEAIAQAVKIPSDSYAYQEAQKLISQGKENLTERVQELIGSHQWQDLMSLLDRLPESLFPSGELGDWKILASAGLDAATGTVESLETAITTAQQIASDRPLYQQAQDLASRWTQEIEGVAHLEKARDFSAGGTINDFNAAIAQAELIASANPRYNEARREIGDWTRQIQTIEDQPLLDRARELASTGSVNALQQAISQASLISSGRALYGEAQQEIGQWQASIQRQQDQPILDQAIALANATDYNAAIRAAQQIGRGRVLYSEARSYIRNWRQEVNAKQDLQEAYLIAQANTPESLVAAISVLRRIPSSTDVSSQSRQALNRWGFQLLNWAQDQANRAQIQEAIQLARLIPSDSSAAGSAQAQIAIWRRQLEPPTPPPAPSLPVEPAPAVETNYSEPGFNN